LAVELVLRSGGIFELEEKSRGDGDEAHVDRNEMNSIIVKSIKECVFELFLQ
jgi:hypothetical protein